MIRLTHDLFASLSASAKALKEEDSTKKVNDFLSGRDLSKIERPSYQSVAIDADDIRQSRKNLINKPIEDTVDDLINNPEIKILKTELDKVEELFNNLRDTGENSDMLYRIERRIEDLKRLIEQKSYV